MNMNVDMHCVVRSTPRLVVHLLTGNVISAEPHSRSVVCELMRDIVVSGVHCDGMYCTCMVPLLRTISLQ